MDGVGLRALNRWTLARQHLVERVAMDATAAVGALAGMQAQHSPSPYIGLWSRLEGFERRHLEEAVATDRVVKATLMRGTLHLVPADRLAHYRAVSSGWYVDDAVRRVAALGVDVAAVRAHVRDEVARRPHTKAEVGELVASRVTGERPAWLGDPPVAAATVAVTTDLVNVREDAAFGWFGGSRYRVSPAPTTVDPDEALDHVVTAYLRAFGPASKADLAKWSGGTVARFAAALDRLDLVRFRSDDGRTLLDLADAPRPPADLAVPVRFLPKWDNLLLAHTRRERVLPDPLRRVVIAKNGDVAPTFLVDGTVAGTWAAPLRGPAVLTLTPLTTVPRKVRTEVGAEAERLLAWLRPDAATRDVRWSP